MPVRRSFIRWSSCVLLAAFAACGGGGEGGGPPVGSVGDSKLFVGDSAKQAIGSSPNSNPAAGTSVIERVISGSSTMLSSELRDFALDAVNDRLYVADLRSILVFNNAGTASGNVAPSRVLNSFLGLGGFVGIYLDTVNDRLYAPVNLGAGSNQVRVFNGASTATNAFPDRTFSFASRFLIDIAVDTTRDILYAFHLNSATNLTEIAVFANASTLNGVVVPTRVITIGRSYSSNEPAGIFIDSAANRLYAPNHGQVLVFDSASTKNGAISGPAAPERVITLPVPGMTTITIELTSNRLYAVDGAGVNVIPNASTAVGLVTAVRILAPPGSFFEAVAVKP